MVGTDASVELIKSLVSNNEVVGDTADMWIASVGFINNPTAEMIKHAVVGTVDFDLL